MVLFLIPRLTLCLWQNTFDGGITLIFIIPGVWGFWGFFIGIFMTLGHLSCSILSPTNLGLILKKIKEFPTKGQMSPSKPPTASNTVVNALAEVSCTDNFVPIRAPFLLARFSWRLQFWHFGLFWGFGPFWRWFYSKIDPIRFWNTRYLFFRLFWLFQHFNLRYYWTAHCSRCCFWSRGSIFRYMFLC